MKCDVNFALRMCISFHIASRLLKGTKSREFYLFFVVFVGVLLIFVGWLKNLKSRDF